MMSDKQVKWLAAILWTFTFLCGIGVVVCIAFDREASAFWMGIATVFAGYAAASTNYLKSGL